MGDNPLREWLLANFSAATAYQYEKWIVRLRDVTTEQALADRLATAAPSTAGVATAAWRAWIRYSSPTKQAEPGLPYSVCWAAWYLGEQVAARARQLTPKQRLVAHDALRRWKYPDAMGRFVWGWVSAAGTKFCFAPGDVDAVALEGEHSIKALAVLQRWGGWSKDVWDGAYASLPLAPPEREGRGIFPPRVLGRWCDRAQTKRVFSANEVPEIDF